MLRLRAPLRQLQGAYRIGIQRHDQRAFRYLVADFDPEFFHNAGGGRGHFQRRLVRLKREQRIFRLDVVAGFDQDFDHRDVFEVADIGDFDFDFFTHLQIPLATENTEKIPALGKPLAV